METFRYTLVIHQLYTFVFAVTSHFLFYFFFNPQHPRPPMPPCCSNQLQPTSPRHPATMGRGRSPTAALYTRRFSLKTRKYAKKHPKHTHQHLPRAHPPCQIVPPTSPRHPATMGRGRSPTAALYTRRFSLKTQQNLNFQTHIPSTYLRTFPSHPRHANMFPRPPTIPSDAGAR